MALPALLGALPYLGAAGIGAGLGAAASRLGGNSGQSNNQGNFLTGTPGQTKQFQNFTPQQQSALDQLLQMGLSGVQNSGFNFEPIANQARTQFYQNTIPSIAERFTAMGNGQRSSAFQGALGQAGAGLEQGLAALQSKYGLAQQSNLLNLLRLGLTPQFENAYFPSQPGLLQSLAPSVGQGLGSLGGLAGLSYLGLI